MFKFYRESSSLKRQHSSKLGNFAIAVITSAFLSACSGGGEANTPQALSATSAPFIQFPANTITRVGTIVFSAVNGNDFTELGISPNLVGAYASFADFGQPLSEDYLVDAFSISQADTCRILIDSSNDSQDFGLEEDALIDKLDLASRNVFAGDAITIATPSGSWPDLVVTDDTWLTYEFQTDSSMLGDAPNGTTLSIPGAEFPAFEQVSIPTVSRLTAVSLDNTVVNQLSADTKVTWSSPDEIDAGSIISISIYNEIVVDNEELAIGIICTVIDDGMFSFPGNVRELFSKYDIPIEEFILSRIRVNTKTRGNTAVIVVNSAVYFL